MRCLRELLMRLASAYSFRPPVLKDKVTETAVFVIAAVGLLFHERAVRLREDENASLETKEYLSVDSNGKKDSGRAVYAQERIQVTEKRVRAFLLAAIVFL